MDNSKFCSVRRMIFTVAVIGLLYAVLSASSTLFDRDEPRFARAAVEMLESGNWLYPTFNGQLRPDKPILIYWLMAGAMKVFGVSAFAVRLPSVIALCLNCVLTFLIGRRLFNCRVGYWAMLILASTLSIIPISTGATADSVLMVFMLAALWCYLSAGEKFSYQRIVFMGLCLGGALLEKGPVGLLPILVIVSYHIIARFNNIKPKFYHWQMLIALIIGIGLFLIWAIPANIATDGEFLRLGIGKHVVSRSLKPMENHGGSFLLSLPYYVPVVIVGLFPWVLFLPAVLAYLFRPTKFGYPDKTDKSQRIFLIGWIVPVFVLMSLVATKLPHYTIFIWPGFAVAIAKVITVLIDENKDSGNCNDRADSGKTKAVGSGIWYYSVMAFLFIIGLPAMAVFGPIKDLTAAAVIISAVFIAMSIAVFRFLRRCNYDSVIKAFTAGFAVFLMAVAFGIMPAIEKTKPAVLLSRAVDQAGLSCSSYCVFDYKEPTLNFYLGKRIDRLSADSAIEWSKRQDNSQALIISQRGIEKIKKIKGDFGLKKIISIKALDNKLKPIELYYCLPGDKQR